MKYVWAILMMVGLLTVTSCQAPKNVQEAVSKISTMEEKINTLETKVDSLENELKAMGEATTEGVSRAQVAKMTNDIKRLKSQNAALEKKVNKLQKDIKYLMKKVG